MMKDFQQQFPVLQNHVYLNTASCGLLSRSLVDWRTNHDTNLLNGGSIYRDLHKTHIKEIRGSVARFFSASEENVALLPNFSFGMNVFFEGLRSGQKVLLLEDDYPSVVWPIEARKFETCVAAIDANLEANVDAAMEEHQPDIFAFSMVQYISGIKIEMDFLKRLKEKYPNLLIVVDGTQFLGTTNFNFNDSPIDVIGGSCYKWMLSGYGNAVFMFKETVRDLISSKSIGFNSVDANYSKRNEIDLVGHFEPGHQDTLNYGSLAESIQFMESLGKQNIENYLNDLSNKAKREFSELGVLSEDVMARSNCSTIFNLKGDENLFQKLKEAGIIASLRGKGIRVSFHFYNTESHLDQLVDCLKRNI